MRLFFSPQNGLSLLFFFPSGACLGTVDLRPVATHEQDESPILGRAPFRAAPPLRATAGFSRHIIQWHLLA